MPDSEDAPGKGAVPPSLRVAFFCRAIVRIWSLAVTAAIGWQAFVLWHGARPPGADLFRLDVMPLLAAYCLGLVVAWLLEFLGGVISLTAVVLLFKAAGNFFPAFFLPCLAVPAILALASSILRDRGRTLKDLPLPKPSVLGCLATAALATVIAAIAIPSLLRTNCDPGSSPIASLKTLVTAEEQYKSASGSACYAALTQLSATTPQYVDSVLGAGKKSGYCFLLTVGTPASTNWYARAIPIGGRAKKGDRYFFVDSSGIIRFSLLAPATSGSAAIE